MLGDVVYTPPKNKYPQYKRGDFDLCFYVGESPSIHHGI